MEVILGGGRGVKNGGGGGYMKERGSAPFTLFLLPSLRNVRLFKTVRYVLHHR